MMALDHAMEPGAPGGTGGGGGLGGGCGGLGGGEDGVGGLGGGDGGPCMHICAVRATPPSVINTIHAMICLLTCAGYVLIYRKLHGISTRWENGDWAATCGCSTGTK